jgi:hypothetical protein
MDTAELSTRIRGHGSIVAPSTYQTYWLGEEDAGVPKAVVRLFEGTESMKPVSPLLLETVSLSFREAGDFLKPMSSMPPRISSRPPGRSSPVPPGASSRPPGRSPVPGAAEPSGSPPSEPARRRSSRP